ncbi:hypothetical protein VTN96DRAFT_8858 [Rasamsonia emersonii]|uniref:NAD(P)-binding domain-containing protein n=1 Tax=Rasamsonia emersonii (strain ATCC 16479 / CBS 393.64 / IMI 116815) TaxID=1408163 RepID=A0A0F4YWJ6_RASE3|nr:Uncharacterized protein T310_3334 [Rasamsonia emersonii CBS 393.64]KKA22652.1 Uncharacterized protein T310_3334 [Rasamsonia emersonii CBS 393.64]
MSPKTIAFLGATGGCTNACLAHTLKAGYHAIALARTPSKLTSLLLQQDGITEEILASQLRIVRGDAMDVASIKKTILLSGSNEGGSLVDIIVSGIGGTPSLNMDMRKCLFVPTVKLDNPHITEKTASALVSALQEIYSERKLNNHDQDKPVLACISTTGLTDDNEPPDVPFLMRAMYHTLLAEPHKDKRKMEAVIDANRDLFAGTVIVRPTLLTGDGKSTAGKKKGRQKLRVGTARKPALGYTVDRADVGEWIFEEVIKTGGKRWFGEKVTLA